MTRALRAGLCDCWLGIGSVGGLASEQKPAENATRKAVKEFVRTVFKLE